MFSEENIREYVRTDKKNSKDGVSIHKSKILALLAIPLLIIAASFSYIIHITAAEEVQFSGIVFLPKTSYINEVLGDIVDVDRAGALSFGGRSAYFSRVSMFGLSHIEDVVLKRVVSISNRVEKIPDASLEKGKTKVISFGNVGKTIEVVIQRKSDDKLVAENVISKIIVEEPVNKIVAVGTKIPIRTISTSRGSVKYSKMMVMNASAYEASEVSCGPSADGYTAIGMKAQRGVVAVDPKVIPLRTKLYIEGYGFAIAADTGSAIKGNKIDLFYDTVRECLNFGRRNVKVYVLE